MSSRIPVDQFGSNISGSTSKPSNCASKNYVNSLIHRNADNDIILETNGNFIIKNPQSNRADSNVIKFYVNDDKIHCNSKRVTDLLPPVNDNDAVTKQYIDLQFQAKMPSFKTYEFNINAHQSKMVTTLNVPIEKIIIQSIWFQTSSRNHWINGVGCDDVKFMVTFENSRLYFYCKKLDVKFNGSCMVIVQILN